MLKIHSMLIDMLTRNECTRQSSRQDTNEVNRTNDLIEVREKIKT